ncbi:hypothetical protein [Marivirga sp.]|uniref:hypothetical protein n=1 Tax=Marivirga sp. TaxID=2018662 RepID=UPI002D7E3425|nr:hypothetical protein [Marivirga sp.]HET8860574.1 hypothetical protein [Marivirga sp.]
MNNFTKPAFLFFALFLVQEYAFSQSFYDSKVNRRWVASGGIGYARSLSDLTNPGTYFDNKFNIEGGIQYIASDRINIRTHLLLFQLSGDDMEIDPELNTRSRGLSFVSNNIELGSTMSISLFSNSARFIDRRKINPYIFGGIGLLYFDPRAEVPEYAIIDGESIPAPRAGDVVSLHRYQTERPNNYSRFALVIPVGFGIKIKATNFMDITLEASNRITFTDYLDDVSGSDYADIDKFDFSKEEDITAWALSNPSGTDSDTRGNPASNDHYLIVNIKADIYIQGDFFNRLFGMDENNFDLTPRRGRLLR